MYSCIKKKSFLFLVPCQPSITSVQKACLPALSAVSWAASAEATNYTADAVSADASKSTCESDQTSCSFPNLQCGKVYTITVVGYNGICYGPQSSNASLSTGRVIKILELCLCRFSVIEEEFSIAGLLSSVVVV